MADKLPPTPISKPAPPKVSATGFQSSWKGRTRSSTRALRRSKPLSDSIPIIIARRFCKSSKIKDSEGRIRNVEFKMGVQIAMLAELLADHLGYSEEDMEQMRADAVRHMKETNGSFRF